MQCVRILCPFLAAWNNPFPPCKGGIQGGLGQSNTRSRKKNLPQPLLRKEGRKKATVASVRKSLVLAVFLVIRHCALLTCYNRIMITHITGQLVEVCEDHVVVDREGVGMTILTPGYALAELAAHNGQTVTLHTIFFIDGGQNSGLMEPHLLGFPRAEDKLFFRRFISVKGIGPKKALKALSEPVGRIANWIEQGDAKALKGLPGIGARAAELIVAELRGKLGDLAVSASAHLAVDTSRLTTAQRDAIDAMISLGDGRADVESWIEQAVASDAAADTVDEWIRAAYRVKTGSVVAR